MRYKILGTGSSGNAIIYFDEILVDIGMSYAKLKEHLKTVSLIFLTHEHGDHFNLTTILQIQQERPDIIWIVPLHLMHKIETINLRNLFVVTPGNKYKMGKYKIEVFELFHDVANVGYKIMTFDYKIVHATDTGKIDHIEAKDFDLYAIEQNHDEVDLNQRIQEKVAADQFAYEIRSRDTHLSFQKAQDWIDSQKKSTSEVIKLHVSSHYKEKIDE